MRTNVEIKARARDFASLRCLAERLSDTPVQEIHQEDTFFFTGGGRLKLREFADPPAQLIYYERSDGHGPKRSDYHIFETSDAPALKAILGLALGVRGRVRKTRYLYLIGNTRLHLDDVERLGQFMELEVVLGAGLSEAEGRVVAEHLMSQLGIAESDLLEPAYIDLLEQQGAESGR
jgi:adenylate cyclase class IV